MGQRGQEIDAALQQWHAFCPHSFMIRCSKTLFFSFSFALFSGMFSATGVFGQTLFREMTLVPMTEDVDAISDAWMLVSDDGYITSLGKGEPDSETVASAANIISLEGKIVMPGFVSGHSHLWQSAFRGIAPDGELWPWLQALHWTYGDNFTEGDMKAFTAHGAWDQLCHGVTTTYNHTHWLDHDYAIFIEQFEAEMEIPQRFIFSSCVDFQGESKLWAPRIAALKKKVDPKPASPLLDVALNLQPYGPPDSTKAQVELAESLDINYQIHYLEQSGRQESDRANWPKYKKAGIPSKRATFAHFIHTDDTILNESIEAGVGMVWNPLSNGRLGSGLADIPKYLEKGLPVAMGVDGQASADTSDPFQNMRMGLYATRMREEHSQGLQPIDMLRLHTIDTAKVLGVEKYVGSLEPGKFADFLIINPKSPITGPVWDVAAHLVFACSASNIESIYVGGKQVIATGKPTEFELAPLALEVETRILALQQRHQTDPAE
ncbi:MAG: amidohydrolase family protein [Opitutales bacterium]